VVRVALEDDRLFGSGLDEAHRTAPPIGFSLFVTTASVVSASNSNPAIVAISVRSPNVLREDRYLERAHADRVVDAVERQPDRRLVDGGRRLDGGHPTAEVGVGTGDSVVPSEVSWRNS